MYPSTASPSPVTAVAECAGPIPKQKKRPIAPLPAPQLAGDDIARKEGLLPLEQALTLITSNPARNLKLRTKGKIAIGFDADLCFLNSELQLTHVIARGKLALKDKEVIKKGGMKNEKTDSIFAIVFLGAGLRAASVLPWVKASSPTKTIRLLPTVR